MNSYDPEHDFRDSLEEFETSLATPVVSGELEAWSEQVRNAWMALRSKIQRQKSLHEKQYQEIADQDPELLSQIERMKEEDAAIGEASRDLDLLIQRLTSIAPKAEPDERRVSQPNSQLIDDGIALVNRVRKQEVAVRTWYVEAFNRDRGVAD
jgi:hypothetical protein